MARLHMLKSLTDTINTSFILESGDTLLLVDGGFPSEAPYLYEYLKQLGGHVTAWFITHIHDDHMGCLCTMLAEHPDIRVDAVYDHFPSVEFASKGEPKQTTQTTAELMALYDRVIGEHGAEHVIVERGDVLSFDGGNVTVRVLRTPDERITANPINNSSCVYRLEINGKSVLFLGDLGVEGGLQLMELTEPDLLHADYVQMAHHGQGGVSREVYEAIRPSYCLWCTPSWLWENQGPRGYDTGMFQTVIVRGWLSEIGGIKRHYRMTEGTHVIEL